MPLDVRDAALLHDMRESSRIVASYALNRRRPDLDGVPMFVDAIIRPVEIVGEAARGVSDACQAEHPDVAWRAITATRHILAHDYDEVNYDTVWRIVHDHLPRLITQLEAILAQAPPPPP